MRNRVLKNWVKLTNARKTDELIKNIRWRMGVYDDVYLIDCNNCGLFVCYFFKNLIESDFASLNQSFDSSNFRIFLKETIEKNSRLKN